MAYNPKNEIAYRYSGWLDLPGASTAIREHLSLSKTAKHRLPQFAVQFKRGVQPTKLENEEFTFGTYLYSFTIKVMATS